MSNNKLASIIVLGALVAAPVLAFAAGDQGIGSGNSQGSAQTASQGAGQFSADAPLAKDVQQALSQKIQGADTTSINVKANANGRVQLSGTVSDSSIVQQAAKIAKEVKGVISVENGIQVK